MTPPTPTHRPAPTGGPAVSVWRQQRLARGWEPVQLIGRMKIAAHRDGVTLPKTWLMVKAVFLWENHRAPVPGYYAELLHRVLTTPPTRPPATAG